MKFVIWRESVAYAEEDKPPTNFKPLTFVKGINMWSRWVIEIEDIAELRALWKFEAQNYTPVFSTPGAGDRLVRLELKFNEFDYDGTITLLDNEAGRYSGYR